MLKDIFIKSLLLDKEILENLVLSIPEERLHLKRGDGFWTIYQHIAHLADGQEMLAGRIKQFIDNPRPKIIPFNPEKQTEKIKTEDIPAKELLGKFSMWRDRQLELIKSAGDEIWKRESDHPEYDLYTFEILVRHILLHDYFHMHRIEELWLAKDEFLSNL